jgi:hypothetical protein
VRDFLTKQVIDAIGGDFHPFQVHPKTKL